MAYTYKKKRYMYQYAKEELKLPVPAMKNCSYRFFRGWECLEFSSSEYICYKLTFTCGGKFISIEEYFYDDDCVKHVVRNEFVKGI